MLLVHYLTLDHKFTFRLLCLMCKLGHYIIVILSSNGANVGKNIPLAAQFTFLVPRFSKLDSELSGWSLFLIDHTIITVVNNNTALPITAIVTIKPISVCPPSSENINNIN